MRWMIYGATGYTGPLVAKVAVERGHQPLLAGRNAEKLAPLADELGLEYVAFSLDDIAAIGEAIAGLDAVYHAAGPFIHTSDPMIRACLAAGTHYLDITGEIPVFEQTFRYDDAARKNGIALVSGVGFDVVPTDCLAQYVARDVSGANELIIGVVGLTSASAGTTKSAIEGLNKGSMVRRNGKLTSIGFGSLTSAIPTPKRIYSGLAVPWGDLSTGYRTTGIPNITTYLAFPRWMIGAAQVAGPVMQVVFQPAFMRDLAKRLAAATANGPDEETRQTAKSYIWARASNDAGMVKEAWLQTLEPYRFTAEVGVRAVERLVESNLFGALTPAQAFGADFVLDVPETYRYDSLDV